MSDIGVKPLDEWDADELRVEVQRLSTVARFNLNRSWEAEAAAERHEVAEIRERHRANQALADLKAAREALRVTAAQFGGMALLANGHLRKLLLEGETRARAALGDSDG